MRAQWAEIIGSWLGEGFTFLMGFTAAIGDLLGLGKALGIPPGDAIGLFDHFNPWSFTGARAKRMASGDYRARPRGSWRWRARTRGSCRRKSIAPTSHCSSS